MKILIASDSFKGSMSSNEVATALTQGFKEIDDTLDIIKVPVSDGGEGMIEALVEANNGELVKIKVKGPLGKPIESFYGISQNGETAYIEVAAAIGLYLLDKNERNPLNTTTFGVGELILNAVKRGCKNIIVGLGGSSTNDGGIGMARALGIRFLSESGDELLGFSRDLEYVKKIDISNLDSSLASVKFRVASDVNNPLTGKDGATYTFASQKGASDKDIIMLEKGMLNYKEVIRKDLNIDVSDIMGAGAAGGLGAALSAYLNAQIVSGIELVMKETNLEEKILDADLIITGEGKIDSQTFHGKVPVGISSLAKKYKKKTIVIAGKVNVDKESLRKLGIHEILCITPSSQSDEEAMKMAKKNTLNIAKLIYKKYLMKGDK